MIFSLQRRFLLLLLLPVTVILVLVGAAGFFYARDFLLEQWTISTRLELEQTAHTISMKLDERVQLINLIARSEGIPSHDVMETFLIQQLAQKDGVRLVDIEIEAPAATESPEAAAAAADHPNDATEGLYTMEVCDDFGLCAPTMDPNALDRSLRIIRTIPSSTGEGPTKKLVVRMSFDSFMEPIRRMWLPEGSSACLATSTGQLLAHTDKTMSDRRMLGETGDKLERQVLREMRKKPFGTVFGEGHPPEVVVGFQKIPSMNWYLILFSKGSVVLKPIIDFRFYYALAGIVALLIIMALIRVVTRSVGHSVAQISEAAAGVTEGDYSIKLPEHESDELGELKRSFNRMVAGLKERYLIEQTFGRYVDKKVAAELMSRPEALRMGGEKRTVTILMSDLRNFTGISERLSPEQVITMMNRYFSRMIGVIEGYKGIIVDFYGDSILVFFNGTNPDITARAVDAVRCGLEMQAEMNEFVRENISRGLPEITMGIGIHTGEVIVGNIGTESRAKYGIVGSPVNVTDRIQYAAGAGRVVISEETYESIAGQVQVSGEFTACLKGVEENHKLYEVEAVRPQHGKVAVG